MAYGDLSHRDTQIAHLKTIFVDSLQLGFQRHLRQAAQDIGFVEPEGHQNPQQTLQALTQVRQYVVEHCQVANSPQDLDWTISILRGVIALRTAYGKQYPWTMTDLD